MNTVRFDPAAFAHRLTNRPSLDRPAVAGHRFDLASCGEFAIRIGRDGTWFYHDSPITRKPLVRLFASVLQRSDNGEYGLVTPFERGRIKVDDLPYVAVAVDAHGEASERRLVFRTNLDESVTADGEHPLSVVEGVVPGTPAPSIMIHRGLAARIARPVFYDLAALAVPGDDPHVMGVWSAGIFFPLGKIG
jgi:uncharacterized protein